MTYREEPSSYKAVTQLMELMQQAWSRLGLYMLMNCEEGRLHAEQLLAAVLSRLPTYHFCKSTMSI